MPCLLHRGSRGRDQIQGVLLDVSRSGLSVQASVELGQGDEVEILVGGDLRVPAIAWHTRRARGGFVVGMMLASVSPEFERFVDGFAPARRAPGPRPPLTEIPQPESWWKLRVKEVDGPRTRVVTLAAKTRELAIEHAMREIGAGWELLEAQPTKPGERKAS